MPERGDSPTVCTQVEAVRQLTADRNKILGQIAEISDAFFGTLTTTQTPGIPQRAEDGMIHKFDRLGDELSTHIEKNARHQSEMKDRLGKLANGGVSTRLPTQYKMAIAVAGIAGVAQITAAIATRL